MRLKRCFDPILRNAYKRCGCEIFYSNKVHIHLCLKTKDREKKEKNTFFKPNKFFLSYPITTVEEIEIHSSILGM